MFRRSKDRAQTGGNPYEGLRSQALTAVSQGLAPPGPAHPHVHGAVIDVPSSGGWVTIVALGDGTTSMYTSVGGGTIGAGSHAAVAAANEQLLAVIEREILDHLDPEPGDHPGTDYVRYHVLLADGLAGIDIPAPVFWGERGGGGNLVDAAQHLIHTISEADPGPG